MSAIELRTHQGPLSATTRGEWELLLDEDPDGSVFQGPRFLGTWQRVLAGPTATRVHTLHRDGRLVGVVPDANDLHGTATGPTEVRRFQGGTEVTDYLGPISRPEDRYDVADAYLRNLATDVDWDEFVAGGLAEDSGWPDALRRAADTHGLELLHREDEDVCPRVDLTGGVEGWRSRLPGKLRQELTRKTRKLARDAGDLELVEVPADQVEGQMDAFLDQVAESFPEKRGFFGRDEIHAWFRALAAEFAADGTLLLHRLDVGGMPAATAVSLVHGDSWGLYNTSFDPALGSLAPGMVMVGLLIEQAASQRIRTFDLLRGDEPYKYRFGAVDRPLVRLSFVRA